MSGVKGRSGGHNRKSAGLHVLHGTFRPARHGSRAAAVAEAAAIPGSASIAPVPADVVRGLSKAGRAFVRQVWAEFGNWSVSELALLRMAGQLAGDVEAAPDARARRLAIQAFGKIVAQLGIARRE